MRILITGITGFIGRHLEKNLSSEDSIHGIYRNKKNCNQSVVPIIADLHERNFTQNFPEEIDCIIHLAQSPMYRYFPEGADSMYRINVDATVQLLEWARKNGVKQFIYSSTANVYSPTSVTLHEECPTIPTSFYGASKLASELLIRQYQKYFQTDILRLFTVYGPGQQNMLIPNMIERINAQQEITLARDVGIYLSPIYVGDVVNFIKKLLLKPSKNGSRLLNVCGDQIVSLSEIVEILGKLMNKDIVTKRTNEPASNFIGNNAQLRKLIDNDQLTDIKRGLKLTVNCETREY